MLGTVVRVVRKHGWIESPAWPFRIFVHAKAMRRGELAVGRWVRFDTEPYEHGRLTATNVDVFVEEGASDGERD